MCIAVCATAEMRKYPWRFAQPAVQCTCSATRHTVGSGSEVRMYRTSSERRR